MSSLFLSIDEASTLLGVGSKTIYGWCQKGFLPGANKIGGRWLINRQTLLDGLKGEPSKPAKGVRRVDRDDPHNLLS